MSLLSMAKISLVQLGYISLHYIDYPIDVWLIIKYFKPGNSIHIASFTVVFMVLPNIILALISLLFNVKRLPIDKLAIVGLILVLNLEPLFLAGISIGLSWRLKRHQGNSKLVQYELKSASFNMIISSLFRSFFNCYLLPLILACNQYDQYLKTGQIGTIEAAKIGISLLKTTIYSTHFQLYFITNEFNLAVDYTRFYMVKLVKNLLFSAARSGFLAYLFTTELRAIILTLCILKFLLNDFFYLVFYLSVNTKTNSLILFWSMYGSFQRQISFMGDYSGLLGSTIEAILFFGCVCYTSRLAPGFILASLASTLAILFSMCFEIVSFKSVNKPEMTTFLDMFQKWIDKQSEPTDEQYLPTTKHPNEDINLVSLNI